MPVSSELQNMQADLSAAIAGRKQLGRTEMTVMLRRLDGALAELRREERVSQRTARVADDLCAAIENQVVNLGGVAQRARQQMAPR